MKVNTLMVDKALDLLDSQGFDSGLGLCLVCGVEVYNVEPDARGYKCESCGERKVYGLEEIVIMYGY